VGTVETDGVDDFDVRLLKLLGAHAATVLDRSERETTLREERDLLDRILETSPVAIAVFNPEGEFVQVGPTTTRPGTSRRRRGSRFPTRNFHLPA